jgi:hypothetical protein
VIGQQVHAVGGAITLMGSASFQLLSDPVAVGGRIGADDLVDDREDRLERGRSLAGFVAAGAVRGGFRVAGLMPEIGRASCRERV